MLKELILATNNAGKVTELQRILKGVRIITPAECGVVCEVEETGQNYLQNALLKAEALYALVRRPVLADDSGLSVLALDGAPGIASARYGMKNGQKLTDVEKNSLVLLQMANASVRTAYFVCCLVLYFNPYRFFTVQETLEGSIARYPAGHGGFGYDPIFYLPEKNQTIAQLEPAEKDSLSHRGKSGLKMHALMLTLDDESESGWGRER